MPDIVLNCGIPALSFFSLMMGIVIGQKWGYHDGYNDGRGEGLAAARSGFQPKDLVDGTWYHWGKYAVRYEKSESVKRNMEQYVFFCPSHPDRIGDSIVIPRDEIKKLELG